MIDFEKISHIIRFGLSYNKMTFEDIVAWSYRKIETHEFSTLFFDIATAKTKNTIIELLSDKIEWNYSHPQVRNLILGYYKTYLTHNSDNWADVQRELVGYFRLLEFESSEDKANDFLYYLAEDWQLRQDQLSGSLTMPAYLIEYLFEYDGHSKLTKLLEEELLSGYGVTVPTLK